MAARPGTSPLLRTAASVLALSCTAPTLAWAQTVHFSTGNVVISVPPGGTLGLTEIHLPVALAGKVSDVNAKVRINHTFVGDLYIKLRAPDGTEVLLSNRRGGSGDNYGTGAADCSGTPTVFDDEASTSISAGVAPFAGSFVPDFSLSAFAAKSGQGIWVLLVESQETADFGALYCFSLDITALVLITFTDIDGDGSVTALTDGLLVLRWMFGFRGATLVTGAVDGDCTRCTAPLIESFLDQLALGPN